MTQTDITFEQQMPLVLRNLENALRSGYSLVQAFSIVAKDLPAPAGPEAGRFIDELKADVPLPIALNNWLTRTPSHDLDLLVATILVQLEAGGNLADKLNLLGQIMAKRSLPAG